MPRKPSRKTLIKKLDAVFSKYIRARDKYCVICGSSDQANNGHLFSRRHYATRWSELNCNQQCYPCNFKHTMDFVPYTQWFIKKHGQEVFDELYCTFKRPRKYYNNEIEELIETYKSKLKELENDN
tara:strand:+ start:3505 stop:3882 length:378 start_codon:yes stop_codon:yes gene_type:complete